MSCLVNCISLLDAQGFTFNAGYLKWVTNYLYVVHVMSGNNTIKRHGYPFCMPSLSLSQAHRALGWCGSLSVQTQGHFHLQLDKGVGMTSNVLVNVGLCYWLSMYTNTQWIHSSLMWRDWQGAHLQSNCSCSSLGLQHNTKFSLTACVGIVQREWF